MPSPAIARRSRGPGAGDMGFPLTVRVLIADDFALYRAAIERALSADPRIEVVGEATDGHETFELARELDPDVIVLDLRMTNGGGMAVLDSCAQELPGTRILVLTANENPANRQAALAAGASGFLTKRTTAQELRDAVIRVHRASASEVEASVAANANGNGNGNGKPVIDDPLAEQLGLTVRQRRIVHLVCEGFTDEEIAARLFVSARTIQYDLTAVKRRLGLTRRSEIARWAVIHSLG